jgi:hypothetical protein
MRAGGQTDRTKLIAAFHNFASAPEAGRQEVATDGCHIH